MNRSARFVVVAAIACGIASQASAGDKVWSVPGIVNNGLATVFSCTNGGTAAANVKVELFSKTGSADASANTNVVAGGTVNFVTKTVAALPGGNDVNLSAGNLISGSARITAPSGVFCSAYVVDAATDPPASAWSLTIVKKTTQKGD